MDLPVKFPVGREKIYREALAFRSLSAAQRTRAMLDVIDLGAAMMKESPHREAMLRLQRQHEEEWRKAQRDLFAHHGI